MEPSWPPEGVSPPGLSVQPHTRHPQNLGFNVYFLIRMPATREPPGGPSVGRGCWNGVFTLSGPHLHPGREIHLPGKAGPPVPPLRVSDRMRVAFFFNLLISFTCSPPAHRAWLTLPASPHPRKSRAYLFSEWEDVFLPEKGKSWKRFKNSQLSLTGFFFLTLYIILFQVPFHGFFFFFLCVYKIKTKGKKKNRFLKFRTDFCT